MRDPASRHRVACESCSARHPTIYLSIYLSIYLYPGGGACRRRAQGALRPQGDRGGRTPAVVRARQRGARRGLIGGLACLAGPCPCSCWPGQPWEARPLHTLDVPWEAQPPSTPPCTCSTALEGGALCTALSMPSPALSSPASPLWSVRPEASPSARDGSENTGSCDVAAEQRGSIL